MIKDYTGYIREGFTYSSFYFKKRKEPSRKFLIFTVGRTGSSLLVSLLNSHQDIECHDELLRKRIFSPNYYIHCKEYLSKKENFGFKLNTYHFGIQKINHPQEFVSKLYKLDYRIINLKRRNIFRQVFSHMYALYRKKFFHKKDQGEQELPPIFIDTRELDKELAFFEKHFQIEEKIINSFPNLCIHYENDLLENEDHQITVDRICDYLGIQHARVYSNHVKTTPKDLSIVIENYEEVFDYIKKTKYKNDLQ